MPRSRTSGLKVSRKTLASGEVREYFYDRRTGQCLSNSRDEALARVAVPIAVTHAPGTIAALVTQYLSSSHYRVKLAPRTQALYRGYLNLIRREWGDLPIAGLKPGTVELIKTQFEETPRKANQIVALLRILLGRAVKWQLITSNAALKPEMLPTPPRVQVWTRDEEQRFLAIARPSLRLAIMLMLYTVQRPGDCLSMTTSRIRERDNRLYISLRQQKTGELIDVPVHNALEPLLRARLSSEWKPEPLSGQRRYRSTASTVLLVPSPTGRPWAYRNFCRAWDAIVKKAGIEGLQRRDLRRTGIVRLAEAGATTPQIAALSGHGIDYCQRIIDTYLPRRTEVALNAIKLWENSTETSKVVRLPFNRDSDNH
jgi:integrase